MAANHGLISLHFLNESVPILILVQFSTFPSFSSLAVLLLELTRVRQIFHRPFDVTRKISAYSSLEETYNSGSG